MPPANSALRLRWRWCGGDRRRDVRPGGGDELPPRGAVVMCSKTIPQVGQAGGEGREDAVDEHRLAVEDVDVRVGDLAVDEERHPGGGHRLEDRHDPGDIGDAGGGVGRRVRRVELDRGQHMIAMPGDQVGGVAGVGQVGGHQRGEAGPRGGDHAVAIRRGERRRRHRHLEVGHDDRAGELARGERCDRRAACRRRAGGRASRRGGAGSAWPSLADTASACPAQPAGHCLLRSAGAHS